MRDTNESLGTLSRADGYWQGRLERAISHPQHTVWAALTAPQQLAQWLAPGSIELKLGGAVNLNFADSGTRIDSTVTAFEAPRLLAYSWSSPGLTSRPVRWQISTVSAGTHLTLTVGVPQTEDIARTCAGWEAHLLMLVAAMDGTPIKFPFEHFKTTREAYKIKAAAVT